MQGGDRALIARLQSPTAAEGDYNASDVGTRDVTIVHETGTFDVRVYTPIERVSDSPLFVWCHGGGWAAGDLEGPEADATSREVSARAGAIVVSVDCRLALRGLYYPAPHGDVVAAYRWALGNATSFGADPGRISLGGASAGANLAAGAALHLRDAGDRAPAVSIFLRASGLPCRSETFQPKVRSTRLCLRRGRWRTATQVVERWNTCPARRLPTRGGALSARTAAPAWSPSN